MVNEESQEHSSGPSDAAETAEHVEKQAGETMTDAVAETGAASEAAIGELLPAPAMDAGDQDELSSEPNSEAAEHDELSEMELNEVIENICNSKADEFRMLGYEHVTGREVWECVSDKYIKQGTPPLHRIVNDILSLKVTQFMNWMTMSIYKSNPFE
ncbi:post-transcriptional regulator [Paenibacillus xerothermodurans]|uniref:Post-transcriptional regulator n=1 Tax=Paenibacillus xerothermodurans TaxID=1977292 RepID=A0A2W1N6N0_PAEXE|nr:hypothetical protein CBW46_018110 [Paenibacillus xerothermodurans]